MVTFNRAGLHIEQCENCRGIFLDRGELEQIVNAEQHHYGGAPGYGGHYKDSPPPHRGGHAPSYGGGHYKDSPPSYGGGHYKDSPRPYGGGRYRDSPPPYGGRRRKRSFLEELFD
jgi:Zn-finger nucleic acid-binding protein